MTTRLSKRPISPDALAAWWFPSKPVDPHHGVRVMTPQGAGSIVADGTSYDEQVTRGKIAVRLDVAVHPSGRLVEYFGVVELTWVNSG